MGRTRLGIPEPELRQVNAVGIFHCLHKIITGYRLPVVTFEIQVRAFAEAIAAQQAMHHAHHFRALFIHRHGVKIVDLDVTVRSDRMGHGAGIFCKLQGLQHVHIIDAIYRGRPHVSRELLIAEHGKTFFQTQLKPVAAGNPITGPVVKVFMGNHAFHSLKPHISGGFRTGQDTGCVENIKPLILHRPHIKVGNGHDHVNIKIVFPSVHLFVPGHGTLEGVHGVRALIQILRLHKELQRHFTATAGSEGIFHHG